MSNNHSLENNKSRFAIILVSNILIIGGLLILSSILGGLIMKSLLGKMPTEEMLANAVGNDLVIYHKALLLGQIGGMVIGFLILPIVYLLFLRKSLLPVIFKPVDASVIPFLSIAFLITFALMPSIAVLGDWNKNIRLPASMSAVESMMRTMEDQAATMTEIIIRFDTFNDFLVVFLAVAILPAVCEELVFRGILQNELQATSGNVHIAIWVSATIFSFIHFQFFGFFPRLVLGLVLGYLYVTSGSLLVSMLMHMTNNGVVVLAMYYYKKGTLAIDPESAKDLPIESIVISIVLSAALMYLCWKTYKQRKEINA